jgi:hypothetical protein
MTRTPRLVQAGIAAALAFGLAACGGGSTTSSGTATTAAAAAPTSAAVAEPTSSAASASADPTSASTAKVSANSASEDEIKDALTAAGVNNADRWAEEVVEYRPYPTDDPNLTKLRQNLAKYNPGQETTDKIVSALQP